MPIFEPRDRLGNVESICPQACSVALCSALAIVLVCACGEPTTAPTPAGERASVPPPAEPRDVAVELRVAGLPCVRTARGRVRCLRADRTSVVVDELEGASPIDLGALFGCALLPRGAVRCWATGTSTAAMVSTSNAFGQLGTRERPPLHRAVTVEELPPASAIATGSSHACAIVEHGAVRCWGANLSGQLGDSTTSEPGGPVVVEETGIVAGEAPPQARPRPTEVPGIRNATALALGGAHSCALLADGTVRCWGANDHGQLGDGSREERTTPVAVVGISSVRFVVARGATTCARLEDRSVRCWGANEHGQLADGTREDKTTPTLAPTLAGAEEIALGGTHGCARFSGGRVRCWGDRRRGACGGSTEGDALAPSDVGGLDGAVQIAAAGDASWARFQDGTIRVWGAFALEGPGPIARHVRVDVPPAASVGVGQDFSCARLEDATVRCWGTNVDGQLGDAGASPRLSPSSVPGITGAAQLSVGVFGACVVLRDGTVRCWGGVPPSERTEESTAPWTAEGVSDAVEVASNGGVARGCAADVSCASAAVSPRPKSQGSIARRGSRPEPSTRARSDPMAPCCAGGPPTTGSSVTG